MLTKFINPGYAVCQLPIMGLKDSSASSKRAETFSGTTEAPQNEGDDFS